VRVYYNVEGHGDGSNWEQLGQDINGEALGDQSGRSVSLSADGKTVAIGADNNGEYSGHVRVYGLDDEGTVPSWNQLGQDIDGEAAWDISGISVSLSADGNTLAIGARGGKGRVKVYFMEEYDKGPSWKQLGQDIDGEAAGDIFGYSVSLSANGKTLAIGNPRNDGNGKDSGHVRVYHIEGDSPGSSWQQLGQDINGEADSEWLGGSVSLSADGKTLAIGAYENNGDGVGLGRVKLYHIHGEGTAPSWKHLGQDINAEATIDNSEPAEFPVHPSASFSADGRTVAIGSPLNNDNGDVSGNVRVFKLDY